MTVTTGLTDGIVGNTEASATRSPGTPRTRSSGSSTASGSSGKPIRQVPLTWHTVWWVARARAKTSASDTASGPGNTSRHNWPAIGSDSPIRRAARTAATRTASSAPSGSVK
jgi:hypothetical protein